MQGRVTHLHRSHLVLLGHLLDVGDELLLLALEPTPLTVQLADGLVQHPLVLPGGASGEISELTPKENTLGKQLRRLA
jgi:hypothetical protein